MSEFLAKSADMDYPQPIQLFAGSREIATNRASVANGLVFEQYEVVSIVAGSIVKFNPAGTDGSEVAQGILVNSVDTSGTGTTDQSSAYYTAGDFNHAALVWPETITTLAQRKAVFARTSIAVSSVL